MEEGSNYPRPPAVSPRKTPAWVTATLSVVLPLLLLLIVWPVGSNGKASSIRVACLSNLKQLSVATILYAGDFDDHMPSMPNWTDALVPYHKSSDLNFCPAANPTQERRSVYYAMNGYALGSKIGLASDAKTVLIFDSTSNVKNAVGGRALLPREGRHQGQTNLAFADSHVRSFFPNDPVWNSLP